MTTPSPDDKPPILNYAKPSPLRKGAGFFAIVMGMFIGLGGCIGALFVTLATDSTPLFFVTLGGTLLVSGLHAFYLHKRGYPKGFIFAPPLLAFGFVLLAAIMCGTS